MNRVYNFCAGPTTLPTSVIEQIASEIGEFEGSGMSLIEQSHRGPSYTKIHLEAIESLRRVLQVPDEFEVLLIQGGATLQFAMAPLILAVANQSPGYVVTGTWSKKALADAPGAYAAWEPEGRSVRFPDPSEIKLADNTNFLHICSNETIHGVQAPEMPKLDVPLVVDMSSDLLTRDINWPAINVAYAGAQKSLGPAGVCAVFVRRSLLDSKDQAPGYLSYKFHADGKSFGNTPPVFSIWACKLMLDWIEAEGGMPEMQSRAAARSQAIYSAIDFSDNFYNNPVELACRSKTNVVFSLPTPELEAEFIETAANANLANLKGHRVLGGIRASLYNGMEVAGAQALADFMTSFASSHS